jgi:chromosome segregation ATPase
LQTLQGQINSIEGRIRNLRSDIDRIKRENEKGKKEKPPKKERDTRREEQDLRQEENKLRNLQQDKAKLEGNPSVAFMRNYNARVQQLAGAISAANQNLAVVKKKADNLRNNLSRTKVTDASTKTTTLGNEFKALRTYVQLDLDAEKERILASYRPK